MLYIDRELFQWEKSRHVKISENNQDISIVGFYNSKSKKTIEQPVIDGRAEIPNELLRESLPLVCLACAKRDNEIVVVFRKTFTVLARPKPTSYVDDDPDILIYDGGIEI